MLEAAADTATYKVAETGNGAVRLGLDRHAPAMHWRQMSDLFPTPSPADWRVLAEKALKDRPLESLVHLDADGLAVRPLYAGVTG